MLEQIRNRMALKWLAIGLLAVSVLLPAAHLAEAAHENHAVQTCELCLLLTTAAFLSAGIVICVAFYQGKIQLAAQPSDVWATPRRPVGRAPPSRS
jgi:hypothetical protein